MEKLNEKDRYISLIKSIEEGNIKDVIDKINSINVDDNNWMQDLIDIVGGESHLNNVNEIIPHIKLYLSTFGGSVYDGLALYDTIKDSITPVDVECSGKIMSMGIIITLAAKERVAHKNTTFMIHSVSSAAFGQLKDMEEDVEETKRLNDMLFDIICQNTKITRDKLTDIYEHKKNWFITAQEALDLGLITKII